MNKLGINNMKLLLFRNLFNLGSYLNIYDIKGFQNLIPKNRFCYFQRTCAKLNLNHVNRIMLPHELMGKNLCYVNSAPKLRSL